MQICASESNKLLANMINVMTMKRVALVLIVALCFTTIASEKTKDQECTDVARDDETLLVFSTLGGGLTAVDPITSEVRWSIDDEPAVRVPNPTETSVPHYLPDPRDGSLYKLGDMGGLKKLPYTIPQLVASAPCRSSDGILYSGKKKDTWFLIDPKTGRREKVLGFGADSKESIGWATSRSVYLGRTQYTVLMYDSQSKDKNSKPWNVTFFDYTSHSMAPEVSTEYEWLHLSGSASGLTVTLDRAKGTFMWQKDLSSPVVAVFLLGPDGLLSVPFTTVSDDALQNIVEYARDGQQNDIKLFQSLYVGEHSTGLYALPSLVDRNTKTISADPPVKLIDGPHNLDVNPNLVYLNTLLDNSRNENQNVIVLGNYQMPKVNEDIKISVAPPKINQDAVSSLNQAKIVDSNHLLTSGEDEFEVLNLNKAGLQGNIIPPLGQNSVSTEKKWIPWQYGTPKNFISSAYNRFDTWLNDPASGIFKVMVIILGGMVVVLVYYVWTMRTHFYEIQSQNNSQTQGYGFKSKNSGSYQELIELGDGKFQVGKICYNSKDLLGKGCDGTFVFKGTFEERHVAVKRLLPECFTLADREVTLLRESDEHENVVRYFCTEQDRQFRYIAVELCSATLQDYVDGPLSKSLRGSITVQDVLRQATNGLLHLHTLNIVHRDIKPQNVLISLPDAKNIVRAMISDFGLCKKLNMGKTSFSKRSGITGTEGWIAPEMLKGHRTTTSVDIFSLGCVFYCVISSGDHPFGDSMKRHANILSYEYELGHFSDTDKLDSSEILAHELITDMIRKDPAKRPHAKDILDHPYFWNADKILNFLQDVSDRVEKLDYSVQPLKILEKNSKYITRDDWNLHLDECITADLRKYRGYHGNSVRDLLRALRNKKHHYHELNSEMQSMLGAIPTDFTDYWISRFPRVLSHSYHALEACSKENSFLPYYPKTYVFSKPAYFTEPTEDFVPSEQPKFGRDSPKKYNKDYRYNNKYNAERRPSPHDIETIGSNPMFRNFVRPPPGIDAFAKTNKKGSYNFHRSAENTIQPQQLSPNQAYQQQQQLSVPRSVSPVPPSASPVPESKYVEDDDGFVLVKPKHNNSNLRIRKPEASKAATNDDANIVWTLPK